MEQENNNQDFIPADGSSGEGGSVSQKGLKEVLEKELGKNFPDEQTAIKAVKDTFNYVGKAGKYSAAVKSVMDSKGFTEDQAVDFIKSSATARPQEVDTSKFVSRDELLERDFYAEKPDLKPYRPVISAFQKANPGKSLEEIVSLPEVKGVIDKAVAHDTIEKQKSVLHSNPKIGVITDKMEKAAEAMKAGNTMEAQKNAVASVMDAYNI